MRAFHFRQRRRLPGGRASFAAFLALTTATASPASAQWPGEIEGRVVDGVSGRPVPGASVTAAPAASPLSVSASSTDGAGRFLLRAVEPGSRTLLVRHPGYAPARREVDVAPGRTVTLRVVLEPVPLPVEGVEARVSAGVRGGFRLEPSAAAPGTVGDLLRVAPGVVVRERGEGGRQTVSIRGGSAAEVLVLVDGVPLNDPVTGEADLSLLSAASVEAVVVLPGARSATYGPRAQTGVVLVETRAPGRGVRLRAGAGSLGRVEGAVEVGGMLGEATGWAVTALREDAHGGFDYRPPRGIGGERASRENADVARTVATASLDAPLAGGRGRVRLRAEAVERGLPGRSFAPSLHARQADRRAQVVLGWESRAGTVPVALNFHGAFARGRIRDPQPPTGLPYDDRTRAWSAGVRLRGGSTDGAGLSLRAGLDADLQGVRAGSLVDAPGHRLDAGILAELGGEADVAGVPVGARLGGRVDRAGEDGGLVPSHEAAMSAVPVPGLTLHAAHRSGFTPPSLADQYFRAGVGVEPNPGLRGERTPWEVEAGVSLMGEAGPLSLSASAAAYRGDVRDMIVWAPDFRFVWSPRNVHVLRRGVDLRAGARAAVLSGVWSLEGSWSRARVTYDRDGGDVQVRYRPRHTATLSTSWEDRLVRMAVESRYTGTRFPVPAPVNELPGFWAVDVAVSARLRTHGWSVEPALRVERVLDARDSMIFGYPDPGRSYSLRIAVASSGGRKTSPSPNEPRNR